MLEMRVNYYEQGGGGTPATTQPVLPHGVLVSYRQSITNQFGFESAEAVYVTTLEDAVAWFDQGIMRSAYACGPDGGVIFEGFVRGVSFQAGQETRSVSLDAMANRVRCKYTTVLGTPGTTSSLSNTDSQGSYGVKDLVVSLNASTSTAATNKATRILAQVKQPRATATTRVATGDIGAVQLTISISGWYDTLGWVVTSRTSTSTTSTTTQVGDLINTSGVGIGVTNNFISNSTENIASSGVSDTEFIEADTTYRQKIEALLSQGNSSGVALSWGVYEGRLFTVAASSADADPTTVHYRRAIGSGIILDTYNNPVNWWDVRPNTIYEVNELMDLNVIVVAPDMAGRSYIARASFSASESEMTLDLEGEGGESIDQLIAGMKV